MAQRYSAKSDALLRALLSSGGTARPRPYKSPFAGARPAIAKAAAVPTVNAMPVQPVDTSGFAGIGAPAAGAQSGGASDPSLRYGPGGYLAQQMVLGALSLASKRKGKK